MVKESACQRKSLTFEMELRVPEALFCLPQTRREATPNSQEFRGEREARVEEKCPVSKEQGAGV